VSTTDRIVESLGRLRFASPVLREEDLHAGIHRQLAEDGFAVEHEVQLAPGCRIDFVVDARVGIEVKKGKPNWRDVVAQVERYASAYGFLAIILVFERGMRRQLPPWWPSPRSAPPERFVGSVGKVPVHFVALSTNWGVAL